jgi:protocatechuate 3,4-dioxygenase beta subunit
MRSIAACFITISLLNGAGQAAAQPPAQPPRGQPSRDAAEKPGSVIRGRVLASDSGRPLRQAQVRISGGDLREGRMTGTNTDGTYEFTDVPAGRYTLTAVKAGYVQLQYGQLRAFEPGKPVDIRNAQTLEKIDFVLPRGAVITGRVVDELGEPVMDIQVTAMRYQFVQGSRRLAPIGRASSTNDIGEFRLFGLLPGQYYVSASQTMNLFAAVSSGGNPLETNTSRSGYAATYYPGTARAVEAQPVTLAIGQTMNDLTIALAPTRTARVSGNVLSSEGRPVPGGAVMVMAKDDPGFMPLAPAIIRPDGTFTVSNLAPGNYTVYGVAGAIGASMEIATADVTVAGEDITGLQLASAKPITVTGRLIAADPSVKVLPAAAMSLTAVPVDPTAFGLGAVTPAKINEDLTFEMKVTPGHVLVRLANAPPEWAVRSVRLGAEDLIDEGLRLKPGEDISGVEIEVTNRPTTLNGAVRDGKGQPSRDYTVVVFSQDRSRWNANTRYIAVGRPDQEGRYRTRVPAGSFYAAALEYMEPGEQLDPGFLEKLRDVAVTFNITASETKTLDLKLTPHP